VIETKVDNEIKFGGTYSNEDRLSDEDVPLPIENFTAVLAKTHLYPYTHINGGCHVGLGPATRRIGDIGLYLWTERCVPEV
jgi:hypothetical protein